MTSFYHLYPIKCYSLFFTNPLRSSSPFNFPPFFRCYFCIKVTYALSSPYMALKCQAIRVIVLLTKSLAVHRIDLSPTSDILKLCTQTVYHDDIRLAAVSVELITQLAVHICRG